MPGQWQPFLCAKRKFWMESNENLVEPAASGHDRRIREFMVYVIPFAPLIVLSLGEHEPAIPGDSRDNVPASPLSSAFGKSTLWAVPPPMQERHRHYLGSGDAHGDWNGHWEDRRT